MRWWVLLSLGAVGCSSIFQPTAKRSEACKCSITPAAFMSSDNNLGVPDQVLGFSNAFSELYLLVEAVPNGEMVPMPHSTLLQSIVSGAPAALSTEPIVFGELNGREWASMVAVEPIPNGIRAKKRYLAVNSGEALLIAQAWTLEGRWTTHEAAIDKMLMSLTWDPVPQDADNEGAPTVRPQDLPLLQARAAHATHLTDELVYEAPLSPPPKDSSWELITYPSAVGDLSAYATKVKTDGKRRPGVLFVEGGFGGPSAGVFTPQGSHNDQSAIAFEQAGMVVMAPSFRGEAGNPGFIEAFYGETEDLLAALQALRDRPDVDPDLVYLVGHSTGGTHVLNAAVATDTYRAAFVFGGRAEMSGLYGQGNYGPEPFDPTNKTGIQLRSAIHWAHQLKRPVHYFEGEKSYLVDGFTMAARSPYMQAYTVPDADHFTVLQPIKQLVVQQIVEDTGVKPAFSFSQESLYKAMRDAADRQAADAAAER